MSDRAALRWLQRGLLAAGLLLIGLWFNHSTGARLFLAAELKQFETTRLDATVVRPPEPRTPDAGWLPVTLASGVFGRIEIPRLGISALILEGTQPAQLDRAVGHILRTAFPGQPGNCALAGHRDTFFRGLGGIRANDLVRIDTLQDTYTYVVEWGAVVEPSRVDVIDETPTPSLTLVTCYPFMAVGPAPDRFVVRARLLEPGEVAAP